jgi:hypothetical protein
LIIAKAAMAHILEPLVAAVVCMFTLLTLVSAQHIKLSVVALFQLWKLWEMIWSSVVAILIVPSTDMVMEHIVLALLEVTSLELPEASRFTR